MRNAKREEEAKRAADFIRELCPGLNLSGADAPVGLILGTGWGDVLGVDPVVDIPFTGIPGFAGLEALEGHARRVVVGTLAGKNVAVLRGRIHLNEEPSNRNTAKMVRLQTEMLLQLGAKTLIVTSAVGALRGALDVGQVALVDGFVTLYAPEMPMWAGEFHSPEDTLAPELRAIAREKCGELVVKEVGHVMVRGPYFEGRKYDKPLLAKSGAGVVGMSMLPEACVASLYPDVRVLGLGFVTNDDVATHSHEDNLEKVKKASKDLGVFLTRIVHSV